MVEEDHDYVKSAKRRGLKRKFSDGHLSVSVYEKSLETLDNTQNTISDGLAAINETLDKSLLDIVEALKKCFLYH